MKLRHGADQRRRAPFRPALTGAVWQLAVCAVLGCRAADSAGRAEHGGTPPASVALVSSHGPPHVEQRAAKPPDGTETVAPDRTPEPAERHFEPSRYPSIEKPNFDEQSWGPPRRAVLDFSTRFQTKTERNEERGFHIDTDGGIWLYICENECERPTEPDAWDNRRYSGHSTWLKGRLTSDKLRVLMQSVAEISDRDVVAPVPQGDSDSHWWAEPRKWPELFCLQSATLMLVGPGTRSGKPRVVAACADGYPAFQLDSPPARSVIETFRTARAIIPALYVCARVQLPVVEIAGGVPAWWSRSP